MSAGKPARPASLRAWIACALVLRGLIGGLLGAHAQPAEAVRGSASSADLLVIEQVVVSDARGRVAESSLQAQLRRPGSTTQGLRLPWSAALDRPLDASGLALDPLAWTDPPLVQPSGGTAAAALLAPPGAPLPVDGLAARVARLAAAASQATAQAAPLLAARIGARLQALGADQAWFNFRQQLPVAGQPRQLTWTLHVAASGVWFAGTPAIDAPGAALLQVSYTPRAAAAGLPAAYRYQEGGWLRWTLSDGAGRNLPGAGARDTQGAFDGAAGLACLLGLAGAAGCDPAQEGVAGLLERLGAAQAEVTVANALRPVYAVTPAGQRLALARLSVERTLSGGNRGCGAPPWLYTNAWRAAFRLESRLDHYRRGIDGHWQLLSSTQARTTAPLVPWKTLSLPLDAVAREQLAQLVIDPDRARLIRLDDFPAGLEDIAAGPVRCLSS